MKHYVAIVLISVILGSVIAGPVEEKKQEETLLQEDSEESKEPTMKTSSSSEESTGINDEGDKANVLCIMQMMAEIVQCFNPTEEFGSSYEDSREENSRTLYLHGKDHSSHEEYSEETMVGFYACMLFEFKKLFESFVTSDVTLINRPMIWDDVTKQRVFKRLAPMGEIPKVKKPLISHQRLEMLV